MNIMQAVILGVVEGLTEFLPVSSTGHLIVASDLLKIVQTDAHKAYLVIIQLAAVLAVIVNYRDKFTLRKLDLWKKVLLAFLPMSVIGFLFYKQIKAMFSTHVAAVMFIVGGVVFLIVEHFYKEKPGLVQDVEQIRFRQAAWIGLGQIFALVPGTSRAGATIIGALLVGLSRKASAEFSFLLALPVMIAASGLDLLKHYKDFSNEQFFLLAVGFAVSFVVAYFVIRIFVKFLETFTFVSFGIYRIIFGITLLFFYC
jgi:undecaprenyl-diphosphatase